MPDWLLPGIAFALVIEGVLPLLAPARWRHVFSEALKLADGQIRFVGALSVALGLGLLLILI